VSSVTCLEVLLASLNDYCIVSVDELMPIASKVLDLVSLRRWAIVRRLYRASTNRGVAEDKDVEIIRETVENPLFMAAGAAAAAAYLAVPAKSATVVKRLAKTTDVEVGKIGRLAAEIVRDVANRKHGKLV